MYSLMDEWWDKFYALLNKPAKDSMRFSGTSMRRNPVTLDIQMWQFYDFDEIKSKV